MRSIKLIVTLLLVLIFIDNDLFGQNKEDDFYESYETEINLDHITHREVGFNMTQLLDVIIPFKQGSTFPGPFAVMWRKGKNDSYFNFQMGGMTNSNDGDDSFLNIQVGFLKKYRINNKMKYYTSKNFLISAGSTIIEQPSFNDDEIMLGFSFAGGFEYGLTKNLSLVTETTFAILLTDNGGFTFLPPVGVYLMGRF